MYANRTLRYKMRIIDTPGISDEATREDMKKTINDYIEFVNLFSFGSVAVNCHITFAFFLFICSAYKPAAVVFVAGIEYKLRNNVQELAKETQAACNQHNIPMLAVATKVDAFDAAFVMDCATTKKAIALEESAPLPKLEGVKWMFTHTSNCEESTVRSPFSAEAYGFEGSTFNVLSGIANTLSRKSVKASLSENPPEKDQKTEL